MLKWTWSLTKEERMLKKLSLTHLWMKTNSLSFMCMEKPAQSNKFQTNNLELLWMPLLKSKEPLKCINGKKVHTPREKAMTKELFTLTTNNGLKPQLIAALSIHKSTLEEKSILKTINGHVNQMNSSTLKLILDKWYFQKVKLEELINSKVWIWASMETLFKVLELSSKMDSLI
jgi:hypothetical protein